MVYIIQMLGNFAGHFGHAFNLVADGESCTDINECMNNPCTLPYECENTDGSYICECVAGYERDQLNICRNINECETASEEVLCPAKGPGFSILGFVPAECTVQV